MGDTSYEFNDGNTVEFVNMDKKLEQFNNEARIVEARKRNLPESAKWEDIIEHDQNLARIKIASNLGLPANTSWEEIRKTRWNMENQATHGAVRKELLSNKINEGPLNPCPSCSAKTGSYHTQDCYVAFPERYLTLMDAERARQFGRDPQGH